MAGVDGRFVWYELITTDMATASAFYASVVGWDVQDGSSPGLVYKSFCSGAVRVAGLMDLPQEARRMGATARWMGYVSVEDIGATTERLRRLGGAVYVPPTDSNIGRIAVVADPQSATFGLVEGLRVGRQEPAETNGPGQIGWRELLAANHERAFGFYSELFGWENDGVDTGSTTYQIVRTHEATLVGGMFNKRPIDPVPFWLLYFSVEDIDAAAGRVKAGGGEVFEGPIELPGGGGWIARCRDPQGAAFSIQGPRAGQGKSAATSEVAWSTEWGGISSRGRLVVTKPKNPGSDSAS